MYPLDELVRKNLFMDYFGPLRLRLNVHASVEKFITRKTEEGTKFFFSIKYKIIGNNLHMKKKPKGIQAQNEKKK